MTLITGIAHINLIVPHGTLDLAEAFYGVTLGLERVPVPARQRGMLAWKEVWNLLTDHSTRLQRFDITPKGQQIHIAQGPKELESARHPCFKLDSQEALFKLQARIYEHYERKDAASPRTADKPGSDNSGSQGVGFPIRFFARDYAGNRLEFSL